MTAPSPDDLPAFLRRQPEGQTPMTKAAKTPKQDVIVVTKRVVFKIGKDLEAASKAARAFQDASVLLGHVEEVKLTLSKRDAD